MTDTLDRPANPPQRIIVGISGASGVIYGITALRMLRELGLETHVVMSRSAQVTLAHESDLRVADVRALADVWHGNDDIGASISSGSFKTLGMLVAPCSIKTVSEIANGISGNLLSRAADVVLKERRRLVLMVRETPLHAGHLRNMLMATESGAVICPPVPAFYARPETLDDMVRHTVGRVLDLFGLEVGGLKRWDRG
jgi:flavin prenyltransferase